MGSVAGGGGEEEAENLSVVDMLHDVVDSFAKQPNDERGNQRESAKGVTESAIVGVKLWGCRIIGKVEWVGFMKTDA